MSELSKENQQKINELQFLEQNRQQINLKKQTINGQLMEIESAIKELENSEEAYKLMGSILVKKSKSDIVNALNEDKKLKQKQIEIFDKEEEKQVKKIEEIRKEIMTSMK